MSNKVVKNAARKMKMFISDKQSVINTLFSFFKKPINSERLCRPERLVGKKPHHREAVSEKLKRYR